MVKTIDKYLTIEWLIPNSNSKATTYKSNWLKDVSKLGIDSYLRMLRKMISLDALLWCKSVLPKKCSSKPRNLLFYWDMNKNCIPTIWDLALKISSCLISSQGNLINYTYEHAGSKPIKYKTLEKTVNGSTFFVLNHF